MIIFHILAFLKILISRSIGDQANLELGDIKDIP